MRLAYLKLKGYKRFRDATVNLDRNLIAFVGPNEAGKTSIFQALMHTTHTDPIPKKELTKDLELDQNDDIIQVSYFIGESDKEFLKQLDAIGKPTIYHRKKKASGRIVYEFNDEVKRNISKREETEKQIDKIKGTTSLNEYLTSTIAIEENDEEEIYEETLLQVINDVHDITKSKEENLSKENIELVNLLIDKLNSSVENAPSKSQQKITMLRKNLESFVNIESRTNPSRAFADYLFGKKSEFKFYNQENRDLRETYSYEEVNNPPIALENLFRIAKLDYNELFANIEAEESGEVEASIITANENLESTYNKYWNQDNVFPRIKLENDGIKILIRSANKFNNISDRSEGLKQFITLLAFALNNQNQSNLILLVDEAEVHLHYNAQIDLISLFEEQKIVNSIFYTTHSAGCLPSDLGTGIRAVQQVKDENDILRLSVINNSVWGNNFGFSPILMAMGASMLAITLARRALISEGETEPILLPRLFRESSSVENIGFQVGPGLSSISTKRCKELEEEAGKVLFFVDGDSGGDGIKEKLIKAKISKKKIFSLPKGFAIEDFVKKDQLLIAVNTLLEDFKLSKIDIEPKSIPDRESINFLERKCKSNKVIFPSKVLIAERLVMNNTKTEIIKSNKKNTLNKIYESIQEMMNADL